MKNFPLVSVIVTTKNEEKNIADCLKSIREQSYPQERIEVIVVDNNSSDNTVRIAKEFTSKVYSRGPERSAQRNFGVGKAKGKYVLYLDADMILSERVTEECVEKCENEDCVALYIPEKIIGEGFWIKVRNFERSFYDVTAIDCVRFLRKKAFEDVGGFDETLTGPEDWDFDRRIKPVGKVGSVITRLYHNEGEFRLKHYLGKKNYYSKSLNRYIQKWGKNDLTVRKQVGATYRLLGIFVENGKWRNLLGNLHLTIGMCFLRGLVGFSYLANRNK